MSSLSRKKMLTGAFLVLYVFALFLNLKIGRTSTPQETSTQRVTVPIAELNFDDPDMSVYEWTAFHTSAEASISIESSLAHSGSALNISSVDSKSIANFGWRIRYVESNPIWYKFGLHFRYWIYVYGAFLLTHFQ